jgi:hypothetical protein
VVLELPHQAGVRRVMFGHYQQSRRILIEAVHDARPFTSTDPGQITAMIKERVNQRARPVTGCGMDD